MTKTQVSRPHLNTLVLTLGLAVTAITPLRAHDDDPKIRDLRPAITGRGYRNQAVGPGQPGGTAYSAFNSQNVTLQAWMPLNQIDNAANGNDCWGYTSPSGREYALMCTSSGTNFIEITDPTNPVLVKHISGPNSLWRDVKTYQDFAYAVSEGGSGIQVMKMTNIDNGNVTLVNTIDDVGTSATHNVAINTDSGYLYRLGGDSNGARIYNLNANPANPQYVGSWNSRYIHDAQIITYASGPYAGREVMFACGGFNNGWSSTGLTIVDVTNKGNMQTLDQVYYSNPGYSHQGWLSSDLNYFYLGDELDEDGTYPSTTHIIDVSDPANASAVGTYTNGNTAVTHNLYTVGDMVFAANYTSGMRLYDASDPLNMTEFGYFDTSNGGDGATFNGLWSLYPYFPSGTVIGSDLEGGLFVWTISGNLLDITMVGGPPATLDPDGDSAPLTITETQPGDLMTGTESLNFDTGTGFTSVPLTNLGGGNYDAVFPPTNCGDQVQWYIEALDKDGAIYRNPSTAPATCHISISAEQINVAVDHDMESNQGWSAGASGDTATTGIWTRVNPVGTDAQPEDDHTPTGVRCWVTGQGSPGGSIGDNDVDNGTTTLFTPTMDLTPYPDPHISYWRWYSNNQGGSPGADTFRIAISANGGSSWTQVEQVGPNGAGTTGGWIYHEFRVADFIAPSSQVQMRFVADDAGSGSIVEAAIDDFQVVDIVCNVGPGTNYCFANPNSSGGAASISASGSDVVADQDLTLIANQMPAMQFGFFLTSQTQGLVFNPGGSQGNLCLGGSILRYGKFILNSGGAGTFSLALDLNNLPNGQGAVQPGETWNYTAWFRDNNPTPTSNFTDGLSILFQ
ncbi:MAG: choice-of-anchor B family protein [Planctomycetota bacterium]|nr:choice-of-anchor B family protein [Planctomycetota bacterium]